MALLSINFAFFHHLEFSTELVANSLRDTGIVSWFLISELVARKCENLEAAILKLFVYLN